jgi:hypothetical protein
MPPDIPGLLFAGSALTLMNPFTSSIQGAWIGELLLGNIKVPNAQEMWNAIVEDQKGHARYPPSPLRGRILNLQGDQYIEKLLRDMGVARLARFGGLFGPFANAIIPCEPKLCANAVQPAKLRKNRSLKPPRLLKVVVLAIVGAWGCCARHQVKGAARAVRRRVNKTLRQA